MKSYFVTWEIDIDADSPIKAAEKAWEAMRRPDSIANVFYVMECDTDAASIIRVDLSDDSSFEDRADLECWD
jgi:hypothetical protein